MVGRSTGAGSVSAYPGEGNHECYMLEGRIATKALAGSLVREKVVIADLRGNKPRSAVAITSLS